MPFTKSELAQRWNINIRTLERWVLDGKLHKLKPNPARGGKVLFTEAEVERFESLGLA